MKSYEIRTGKCNITFLPVPAALSTKSNRFNREEHIYLTNTVYTHKDVIHAYNSHYMTQSVLPASLHIKPKYHRVFANPLHHVIKFNIKSNLILSHCFRYTKVDRSESPTDEYNNIYV